MGFIYKKRTVHEVDIDVNYKEKNMTKKFNNNNVYENSYVYSNIHKY